MDPARLGVWTSIGVNYAIFQPSVKAILERYLIKFSKGGKTQVHEDDLGLIEEDTGTICEKCATKLGERLRERKTEPVAERERFV